MNCHRISLYLNDDIFAAIRADKPHGVIVHEMVHNFDVYGAQIAGGLTDVHTTMRVTATATGAQKTYTNPQGTPFQPLQDTAAFSGCP